MTEIPEHLLKRAAERRAAKSGGGDAEAPASGDAAPASPAESAPAAVEKAAAAPTPLPTLDTEAAAAPPDSPVVAAAKSRKRVPYWAASVIALLPLWGVIYYASVQPPPAGESDPLVIGAEVYGASCASCHGANGEGGTGAQLSNGEVLATFPDPLAMAHWIDFGAAEGARPDGSYGDPAREGGARNIGDLPGVMPPFPDLDPEEMAALIIYIREELSGGLPEDDPLFNVETFESDPELLVAALEAVKELGPTGEPDLVAIEGAETDSE